MEIMRVKKLAYGTCTEEYVCVDNVHLQLAPRICAGICADNLHLRKKAFVKSRDNAERHFEEGTC